MRLPHAVAGKYLECCDLSQLFPAAQPLLSATSLNKATIRFITGFGAVIASDRFDSRWINAESMHSAKTLGATTPSKPEIKRIVDKFRSPKVSRGSTSDRRVVARFDCDPTSIDFSLDSPHPQSGLAIRRPLNRLKPADGQAGLRRRRPDIRRKKIVWPYEI
jgi:hypothetical protein